MMKKILFLLALIPFFTECKSEASSQTENEQQASQAKPAPQYFTFYDKQKELFGVMDLKGNVVIEPRWKDTPYLLNYDRVWGTNSTTHQYELYTIGSNLKLLGARKEVASFAEDVTPVCDEKGHIQFVDIDNKVKFTLKELEGKPVEMVRNFTEGICIVTTTDGMMGAIDKNGKTVIKPEYTLMSNPSNGKLLVCEGKYNKEVVEATLFEAEGEGEGISCDVTMQVMDLHGKVLGEIDMTKYSSFNLELYGDYVRVCLPEEKSYNEALLDVKGNVVAEMDDNTYLQTIADGMYVYNCSPAYDEDMTSGVKEIATGKEIAIPAGSKYVELAGDGGWIFCGDSDTGFTLVNRDGRKLMENGIATTGQFHNGLMALELKDEKGYAVIDLDGNVLANLPKEQSPEINYGTQYELVSSHYMDVDALVKELRIQKDGFMGMTVQKDIADIDKLMRAQVMKAGSGCLIYPEYMEEDAHSATCVLTVNGVSMDVGMSFKEPLVTVSDSEYGYHVFRPAARPSFLGFNISLSEPRAGGNTRQLLDALKAKARQLGTVEEEGKNGLLVRTGDNQGILVAFDGYNVFMLFGSYEGVNFSMEMFDTDKEDENDYKDFGDLYISSEG